MLLTIHNLPSSVRYTDIKALLQSKCGLSEVILDNLLPEGTTKKVTVGLAEESAAAMVMKNLNGSYFEGRQLIVRDVRENQPSNQPYYKNNANPAQAQSGYQSQMNYQQMQLAQYPGYQTYQGQDSVQYPIAQQNQAMGQDRMMMMPNMMNSMYYMPMMQNSYMDYSGQGQMAAASQYSQFPGKQGQAQGAPPVSGGQSNQGLSRSFGSDSSRPSYDSGRRGQSPGRGDDNRRRSRSPHQSGRSDYSDRGSNRYRTYDQDRGNDRRDSNANQASQRYNSGRNDNFPSQNPVMNTPITQKLLSISNNPIPSSSAKKPWEKKNERPGKFDGKTVCEGPVPFADKPNNPGGNDWNDTSYGNSQGGNWHNDGPSNWNRAGGSKSQGRGYDGPSQGNQSSPAGQGSSRPAVPRQNSAPFDQSQNKYKWQKGVNPSGGSKPSNQGPAKPASTGPRPVTSGPGPQKDRTMGEIAAMIRRDMSFRLEAASEIVKQMKPRVKTQITDKLAKSLKRSIRARLEILLAEGIGLSKEQMVQKYRSRFRPQLDDALCKAVLKLESSKSDTVFSVPNPSPSVNPNKQNGKGAAKPAPAQKSVPASRPAPASKPAPSSRPGPSALMPLPKINPPPPDKLPKYPNADKKVYKAIKSQHKMEYKSDDFYREELVAKHPAAEAELSLQAQTICDLVKNILENPDDETERSTCKKILNGSTVPSIRKALVLNVTKRILNIPTGLVVRIFAHGQPPKKTEVDRFMAQFDVTSLKKSNSKAIMYVANCGSHRSYDEMCRMGSVAMNENTTLTFKPYQVAGPRMSVRERKALKKSVQESFMEGGGQEDADDMEEEGFDDSMEQFDESMEDQGDLEDTGEDQDGNMGETEEQEGNMDVTEEQEGDMDETEEQEGNMDEIAPEKEGNLDETAEDQGVSENQQDSALESQDKEVPPVDTTQVEGIAETEAAEKIDEGKDMETGVEDQHDAEVNEEDLEDW